MVTGLIFKTCHFAYCGEAMFLSIFPFWICPCCSFDPTKSFSAISSVILLQIVMVSPRTHLVKILNPGLEPLSPSSKKQ